MFAKDSQTKINQNGKLSKENNCRLIFLIHFFGFFFIKTSIYYHNLQLLHCL